MLALKNCTLTVSHNNQWNRWKFKSASPRFSI